MIVTAEEVIGTDDENDAKLTDEGDSFIGLQVWGEGFEVVTNLSQELS